MLPRITLPTSLIAQSYVIQFKLPSGFTSDSDGNRVPAAETILSLNCRLKKSKLRNAQATQIFPGTDTHQTLYEGWVNQGNPAVFPAALRKQRNLVGTVEIDGISGRIECKPWQGDTTTLTDGRQGVEHKY